MISACHGIKKGVLNFGVIENHHESRFKITTCGQFKCHELVMGKIQYLKG